MMKRCRLFTIETRGPSRVNHPRQWSGEICRRHVYAFTSVGTTAPAAASSPCRLFGSSFVCRLKLSRVLRGLLNLLVSRLAVNGALRYATFGTPENANTPEGNTASHRPHPSSLVSKTGYKRVYAYVGAVRVRTTNAAGSGQSLLVIVLLLAVPASQLTVRYRSYFAAFKWAFCLLLCIDLAAYYS